MNIYIENSQTSLYELLTSHQSTNLQNNPAKLIYKTGETKNYYDLSIHPNFLFDSKICEAFLIKDITSEVVLKETQFVEKAKDINLYIASISHDLRTPVNGIKGMLDNIIQATSNLFILDCVKSAQRSSDMLLLLIKDILDLSQIESNSVKLNIDNVNIIDAIHETYTLFEKDFEFRHIKFIFNHDRLCNYTIPTDLIRYKQIISNLISNALKYTLKGSITLTVKLNKELGELETVVEDTGVGIKEERLSKLFKLFTKIEENINLNKEGVGLGLSICKKLVTLLGGSIKVYSQYNQGTRFVFTINFLNYLTKNGIIKNNNCSCSNVIDEINFQECPFILDIITDFSHCECPKLLFVDDNITNLQVLAGYIRNIKIKCDTATNGLEAVHKIRERFECPNKCSYLIIFLDIKMPIMDGFEACNEITKIYKEKKARFIPFLVACTADTVINVEEKREYIKSGFNLLVYKPLSKKTFTEILVKCNVIFE